MLESNHRVLIVDDQRAIHDDLRKLLSVAPNEELNRLEGALFGDEESRAESFDLDSAYQGEEGVAMVRKALAESRPYALAIIDMRMPPGWDGLYTIEKMWELDLNLQIVICTAYSDWSWPEIRQRFGATDRLLILKKPFDLEEVCQLAYALTEKWRLARQAQLSHIQLRRLHGELQLQKDGLEDIVACRTRDLSEAHARLITLDRAKTEFLNLISHELRTPLNGLIGVGELILSELKPGMPSAELRELFEQSRHRILSVIDDALLVTQIDVEGETFMPVPVALGMMWDRAVKEVEEFASARQVMLRRAPGELGLVLVEPELAVKALRALIETAVRFSTAGEAIEPVWEATPESQRLIIDSHGATCPAPLVARFFDLLSIGESETAAGHVGLGPAVASRILSLFGGAIDVENLQSGIRLTVCFKTALAQTPLEKP